MYATLYPERSARIRANRGLPANIDFGPPEPEIVAALVNGTSPILRAGSTIAGNPRAGLGHVNSSSVSLSETMRQSRDTSPAQRERSARSAG